MIYVESLLDVASGLTDNYPLSGIKMTARLVVIGMGYVGIPCGSLLADVDEFEVVGPQKRSKRPGWKIEVLNSCVTMC